MYTKEEITDKATQLMKRNGIRAIHMETLARDIQVSKKHLYEHFKDREEVLAACIEVMQTKHRLAVEDILRSSHNPMVKVACIYTLSLEAVMEFHSAFFYELKKYHSHLYDQLEKYRHHLVQDTLAGLLREAQRQGLLVDGVDIDLFCEIQILRTGELLENLELRNRHSQEKIFRHLILGSLRGILKKEHADMLDGIIC